MSTLVASWLKVIAKLLDKDSRDEYDDVNGDLTSAFSHTIEYYKDVEDQKKHPVILHRSSSAFIVDCIEGLISLAKEDYEGMKPLAINIGGFPHKLEKLDQFI